MVDKFEMIESDKRKEKTNDKKRLHDCSDTNKKNSTHYEHLKRN